MIEKKVEKCIYNKAHNECRMRYKCSFTQYGSTKKTCRIKGDLSGQGFRRQSRSDIAPGAKLNYKDLIKGSI